MGAHQFGRLVDRAMVDAGMSQARLAVLVGELPDGRVLNETQVRRIREGRRRLDHVLVARLTETLDLDPAEAWAAAGLWPPDLELSEYRRLREAGRPAEPALTRVGGSDTPLAASLRKATTTPRTKGRPRGNSCYLLLRSAHIGQRVAA
jgi:hypothetical protein